LIFSSICLHSNITSLTCLYALTVAAAYRSDLLLHSIFNQSTIGKSSLNLSIVFKSLEERR